MIHRTIIWPIQSATTLPPFKMLKRTSGRIRPLAPGTKRKKAINFQPSHSHDDPPNHRGSIAPCSNPYINWPFRVWFIPARESLVCGLSPVPRGLGHLVSRGNARICDNPSSYICYSGNITRPDHYFSYSRLWRFFSVAMQQLLLSKRTVRDLFSLPSDS
jgi:hypothetical protein